MKPSQIIALVIVAVSVSLQPLGAAEGNPPPPVDKPEKPEKPPKEEKKEVSDLVQDLRDRVAEYNRQKNELVSQYKDATKEKKAEIREKLKELQSQFREEQKEFKENVRREKLGDLGRVVDDKVRPPTKEEKDKGRAE